MKHVSKWTTKKCAFSWSFSLSLSISPMCASSYSHSPNTPITMNTVKKHAHISIWINEIYRRLENWCALYAYNLNETKSRCVECAFSQLHFIIFAKCELAAAAAVTVAIVAVRGRKNTHIERLTMSVCNDKSTSLVVRDYRIGTNAFINIERMHIEQMMCISWNPTPANRSMPSILCKDT